MNALNKITEMLNKHSYYKVKQKKRTQKHR